MYNYIAFTSNYIVIYNRGDCFIIRRRKKPSKTYKPRPIVNEWIYFPRVAVISKDGKYLGEFDNQSAKKLAQSQGLDLLCVNKNANPPVCRILDHGKYKYNQAKFEKEAKKDVVNSDKIKEIRLSAEIDTSDLNIKLNHAKSFLQKNQKVIVTLRFRGRQIVYSENGRDVMNKFVSQLEDYAVLEHDIAFKGRSLTVTLLPLTLKDKQKKTKEGEEKNNLKTSINNSSVQKKEPSVKKSTNNEN